MNLCESLKVTKVKYKLTRVICNVYKIASDYWWEYKALEEVINSLTALNTSVLFRYEYVQRNLCRNLLVDEVSPSEVHLGLGVREDVMRYVD